MSFTVKNVLVNEEGRVLCPVCHTDGMERHTTGGGDDTAVYVHPDHDEYDSPIGTRGGYVEIAYVCDNDHRVDLVVANHKGSEYIGWVTLGE